MLVSIRDQSWCFNSVLQKAKKSTAHALYLPVQEIKALHRNLVMSRLDHWFIPSDSLLLTTGQLLMFKRQKKTTFKSTFSRITLQRRKKNVLVTYANRQLMPCSTNCDYSSLTIPHIVANVIISHKIIQPLKKKKSSHTTCITGSCSTELTRLKLPCTYMIPILQIMLFNLMV